MKLKSLLLGSVAAVGLSTTAFAADLSTVVSSFDVCEDLGISGTLQIASTDDCLQISGEVKYEFIWGDFAGSANITDPVSFNNARRTIDDNNDSGVAAENMDWQNDLDWWLMFVGSASSEFGTAKAVIKLSDWGDERDIVNEQPALAKDELINTVQLDEAYVSVGDGTTLVAGKRDTSVLKDGDDTPFGFIGLFNSDAVDSGVGVLDGVLDIKTKGRVIQLYHAVGDSGVTLSGGLEALDDVTVIAGTYAAAGTAIGTIAYAAPDGALNGYMSFAAGGFLDGTIEDWLARGAATATFDNFKVRGAFAYGSDDNGATTAWNGLVTAEGTFDIFTLAAAAEFADRSDVANDPMWGASLTGSAAVTDQVTIQAGFRYLNPTTAADDETWQAALKLIAKLTDTLTATGEVGYYAVGTAIPATNADGTFYGKAELAWKPGGQFETSIAGEMNSLGAYKTTFKASKKFD
ncbi:MAG: hypothetical protein KKH72_03590 [Alphaproteobacteria bacterium]|nr:hypothetical protein [Alphaproteobacteria bacterium]